MGISETLGNGVARHTAQFCAQTAFASLAIEDNLLSDVLHAYLQQTLCARVSLIFYQCVETLNVGSDELVEGGDI